MIKNKEFCGKKSESLLLRTELTNVLLLGVGDIDEINLDILQDVSANASVTAKTLKCKTYVFNFDYSNVSESDIEAIVRGADLGLYDFNTYKSEKKSFKPALMKITINNKLVPSLNKIIKRGEIISCVDQDGKEIARGLSNYNSVQAALIIGKSSKEIQELLGCAEEDEIIHRDNMIMI